MKKVYNLGARLKRNQHVQLQKLASLTFEILDVEAKGIIKSRRQKTKLLISQHSVKILFGNEMMKREKRNYSRVNSV